MNKLGSNTFNSSLLEKLLILATLSYLHADE